MALPDVFDNRLVKPVTGYAYGSVLGNAIWLWLVIWIAYGGAGIATAIALQKKGRSWLSPPVPSPKERIPSLIWHLLFVGVVFVLGGPNWRDLDGASGYFTLFAAFAVLYLSATSVIGTIPRNTTGENTIPKL